MHDINPVGPHKDYCAGYGEPGALGIGYVSVMKLATGLVDLSEYQGDRVLDGIVAYDKAEKANAYIGQINMGTASSFCGPSGRLWGYDLAAVPHLTDRALSVATQFDGSDLPVYSADPLLAAAQALFGTEALRRFPLLPGAYVVCANKHVTAQGAPGVGSIWCYIAVAVPQDRENSAALFMEDAGSSDVTDQTELDGWLARHADKVVNSAVACGRDQRVLYKEIFISWAGIPIPSGWVGTALACAPYITLAQNAVVGSFGDMMGMSLAEWDQRAGAGVGSTAQSPR